MDYMDELYYAMENLDSQKNYMAMAKAFNIALEPEDEKKLIKLKLEVLELGRLYAYFRMWNATTVEDKERGKMVWAEVNDPIICANMKEYKEFLDSSWNSNNPV